MTVTAAPIPAKTKTKAKAKTPSWRDVLSVHPAADLFPLMTPDELRALGEDIKKSGLKIPVTVWSGKGEPLQLLDGRNRLDAMEAVGIPIKRLKRFIEYYCEESMLWEDGSQCINADTDPYAYVISANIHRRHLTAEQKRDLIAAVLKAQPDKSNRTIAKQTKADHKMVGTVREKLEATGEIPQLDKTTGADGKARAIPKKKKERRTPDDFAAEMKTRKQLAQRPIQPAKQSSSDRSRSGVPEVSATPEKLTGGLPTGSFSQKTPARQATVVETLAQPENPIRVAWVMATREQREEFSRAHGESVVNMFMANGRRSDDPLKYRIYKSCEAIEIELGDNGKTDSEEIAGLRTEYEDAADALEDLECQISDARADEEEAEDDEAEDDAEATP
jgi:hypothetical protein